MTIEAIMPSDFTNRISQVNDITKNYVIISMGAALIPIPLLDLVAISSVQLKMLHKLASLYQIKFSKNLTKPLIGALLGGLVPVSISTRMASLAKGVLGVGTATGIISLSILSGAATYAISRVFTQHFESGGTFLDFEPEKVREYFINEFKRGQTVAEQLKENTVVGESTVPVVKPEAITPQVVETKEEEQLIEDEDFSLNKKYCSYEHKHAYEYK